MESVNELAQIMKDLSVLVIDQGTIVDRIDYNIQNVATTVEEGLKQLQKAERTQKHGGMVRCATVLIIMCFMLVLLILKEIFLWSLGTGISRFCLLINPSLGLWYTPTWSWPCVAEDCAVFEPPRYTCLESTYLLVRSIFLIFW